MASIFRVVLKLRIIRVQPCVLFCFEHFICCAVHQVPICVCSSSISPWSWGLCAEPAPEPGSSYSHGSSIKENNKSCFATFHFASAQRFNWYYSLQQQLLPCCVLDVTQWEENPTENFQLWAITQSTLNVHPLQLVGVQNSVQHGTARNETQGWPGFCHCFASLISEQALVFPLYNFSPSGFRAWQDKSDDL